MLCFADKLVDIMLRIWKLTHLSPNTCNRVVFSVTVSGRGVWLFFAQRLWSCLYKGPIPAANSSKHSQYTDFHTLILAHHPHTYPHTHIHTHPVVVEVSPVAYYSCVSTGLSTWIECRGVRTMHAALVAGGWYCEKVYTIHYHTGL